VKSEKVVFLGDVHFPYADRMALGLASQFLASFKPDFIYLIGDIVDFYALSTFDRDPNRLLSLQDELDQAKAWFGEIRKICPKSKIHYRDGNHENRLLRYLWRRPELSPLRSLTIPELMSFSDYGITHHKHNSHLEHREFQVEHGDMVRKHSAYTASGMLDKRQMSGISGHTHRMGMHWRTDTHGMKVWVENGCLCNMKPEYIIGTPNWQQGFTVAHWVYDNHRFIVEQVPIIGKKIYYHGRMWRQDEL